MAILESLTNEQILALGISFGTMAGLLTGVLMMKFDKKIEVIE